MLKAFEDMDIYMRRRIVAGAIVVGFLVLLIALIGSSGGSSHVTASDQPAAVKAGPPPLQADAPAYDVAVPTAQVGEGPFMTIDGQTLYSKGVANPGRKVALTFDDGPVPLTNKFLDKLDRLNAKATFFVIGSHVGTNPEIVKREARMGMTIGNHSYDHNSIPSLAPADQAIDISRNQGLIDEAIGRKPYFFRFPGQAWDFASAKQMAQQGLVGVRFSIDVLDWQGYDTKSIVAAALKAKPGDVIQMHDGGPNREPTLAAVGPIVKGLRKRGLEPVTLDELYRPTATANAKLQTQREAQAKVERQREIERNRKARAEAKAARARKEARQKKRAEARAARRAERN